MPPGSIVQCLSHQRSAPKSTYSLQRKSYGVSIRKQSTRDLLKTLLMHSLSSTKRNSATGQLRVGKNEGQQAIQHLTEFKKYFDTHTGEFSEVEIMFTQNWWQKPGQVGTVCKFRVHYPPLVYLACCRTILHDYAWVDSRVFFRFPEASGVLNCTSCKT